MTPLVASIILAALSFLIAVFGALIISEFGESADERRKWYRYLFVAAFIYTVPLQLYLWIRAVL